jgi:hypothetical protein
MAFCPKCKGVMDTMATSCPSCGYGWAADGLAQTDMKSGACPKCGAASVHRGSSVFLKQGVYGSNSIPISATESAPLDNYVCTGCGYVESYVADGNHLDAIAMRWPAVRARRESRADE